MSVKENNTSCANDNIEKSLIVTQTEFHRYDDSHCFYVVGVLLYYDCTWGVYYRCSV